MFVYSSKYAEAPIHYSPLKAAAKQFNVPYNLLKAVALVESSNNPNAISPKGAIGLMQIMPFNAARCRMTVKDLYKPHKNALCGAQILKEELDHFKNEDNALRAYNAGRRGMLKRYKETENYVKRVRGNL